MGRQWQGVVAQPLAEGAVGSGEAGDEQGRLVASQCLLVVASNYLHGGGHGAWRVAACVRAVCTACA